MQEIENQNGSHPAPRELLARLSRIQRSSSHHAPLQEVLDAISQGASELLAEPIAGVALIDGQRGGQITVHSAIEGDTVVVLEDLQNQPGLNDQAADAGLQIAIAAPIREAGAVIGSVVVASQDPDRKFSAAEREAFSAFADHASLVLADARLTHRVERALHDPLTGLPNRSFLIDVLAERLDTGEPVAVISLNLDRFRTVYDRIGHAGADQVLIELGERLRDQAGDLAVVARLESDTFALLVSTADARSLAERVLATVAEPFDISGRKLRVAASIGVVESGGDPEQMLRDAGLAMSRASRGSGARIKIFEPGMRAELIKRMELQDDLARALEEDEITAYFQPQVDLRSARVIGVEALVRWIHPERGLVLPADFLDQAEAGGHMRALTERLIEFSTRTAGDWWHSGLGLQLSVNLSASAFSEPGWKLHEFISRTLARTGLPGKALQFELTEDTLMADPEEAATMLRRLSGLGASISIDDFGTGHSSLGRLKSLPIDELKIDRSFIFDLSQDEEDRTIVRSTIHLAHQMGLQVLAEGVETEKSWRQLRSMGCERAQGYLIAKPMPSRDVPAWLASWNQRARELRSTSRTKRPARIGRSKQAKSRPAKATA